MTGKADKRRPLFLAVALVAAIGTALVAPVIIGARRGEPIPGSTVRADTRERISLTAARQLAPSVVLERGMVAVVGSDAGETRIGAAVRALVAGGAADLVLDGAKLTIDRSADASSNPLPGDAAPVSPEEHASPEELAGILSAIAGFKFRSLAVLDTKIVIKTAYGATQTISILNADLTSDRAGAITAKGRLKYLDEPVEFDLALASPPGKPEAPLRVWAKLDGKYLDMSFDGRLANDRRQILAQSGEFSISDVRGFARWLGISWPAGSGLGLFTANGQLALDERAVSFEHAQLTLDGNAATGALAIKFGAERPSVEGTLAFATFDVAPYTTPSRPYAIALAADWLAGLRIPGLSSPSFLREIDADIRISAGNVMSGSDRLGRCAASVSVKNGKLYGEIAELELEHGGNGEGQFTVDMTGADPIYTLRAELDNIDLATVVTPRLGPAIVDGAGDIKLDLSAHGASESEVMRTLAGTLSLDMSEGGRLGVDLDALAPVAAAPAGGWGEAATGTTAVSSLTARFTAVAGVLTADALLASTDDLAVTASGSVDVDSNALDLSVSIRPSATATEAGTAVKAVGAFKIEGPWAAPHITRAEPGKAAHTVAPGADPG